MTSSTKDRTLLGLERRQTFGLEVSSLARPSKRCPAAESSNQVGQHENTMWLSILQFDLKSVQGFVGSILSRWTILFCCSWDALAFFWVFLLPRKILAFTEAGQAVRKQENGLHTVPKNFVLVPNQAE